MKIVLVYLIKGPAKKYQNKLAKEVGPRFGEYHLIKNPIPAHITLKSPFEVENIKGIEQLLRRLVKNQKKSIIKIKGFGNFRRFVAFFKTKFSLEAKKTQKQLIKELSKAGIKIQEFDINFKPHATIAYGNTKKTFNDIWGYLNKIKKPNFNLEFDNITILKKPRKYWKIYKEFKIK